MRKFVLLFVLIYFFFGIKFSMSQHHFVPTDISCLELWLEADSVILNGDDITQWTDISGNNRHALPNLISERPIFISNISILNNKPSVRFNGTTSILRIPSSINVAEAYIISNWQGGGSVFSDYKGLLCSSQAPWDIFIAQGSTSNIYGIFGSNYYMNNNLSQNYTPFINYKITSGYKNASLTFNNLVIGNGEDYPGRFWNGDIAEIIVFSDTLSISQRDSIFKYLRYKYAPPVNLGPDINITYGFCDTTLYAGDYFTHYLWNTGNPNDTLSSLIVKNGGTFAVTVTDIFGFESVDTVFINKPSLILYDTTLCEFNSAVINSQLNHDYTFLWSTAETDSFITVANAGKYWLRVNDSLGCSITDTFYVNIDSFPSKASLGPDATLCIGDTIRLVWGASQAISYLWNDNSTNPYFVIENSGSYSVTITDLLGCVAVDTIDVTIKGLLPITEFMSDSVCVGGVTHFTDESSVAPPNTITAWQWDFGDGYYSNIQNPTHTYSQAGIYDVTLTSYSDVGCMRSKTQQVIVYSIPVADYIPSNGCSEVLVQFHDNTYNQIGTISEWKWNFGDPSSGINNESTLQNPTHTFINEGYYPITLVSTSEGGCFDTIVKNIHIRPSANVDFEYTETCVGELAYFTDLTQTPVYNSIIEWHWDFGDGYSSNIANPSHLFDTAGIYQVRLSVKSLNGCEISITKPVIIYAKPIPDFVQTDICANVPYQFVDNSIAHNSSIIYWEWQINNIDTVYLQNPNFVFPSAGVYIVKLITKTNIGCADSISRQVTVYDSPEADFSFSPKYGIAPLTVNFNNLSSGGNSYYWNFGDGVGASTLKNPNYTFTENGIYNIILKTYNANNCIDSIIKQIKIIPSSIDIGVKNIKTSINNNYLSISADLINLGTHTIEELYLYIESNQSNNIRENWKGILESGNQLNYKFNAEIPLTSQTLDYICVRASVPGLTKDDNPNNDTKCSALVEEFILLEPYPNPTLGTINLPFILPLTDELEISLYNSIGNKIDVLYIGGGLKGYNIKTFDLSKLSQGMYAFQIKYRDKVKVAKFIKN